MTKDLLLDLLKIYNIHYNHWLGKDDQIQFSIYESKLDVDSYDEDDVDINEITNNYEPIILYELNNNENKSYIYVNDNEVQILFYNKSKNIYFMNIVDINDLINKKILIFNKVCIDYPYYIEEGYDIEYLFRVNLYKLDNSAILNAIIDGDLTDYNLEFFVDYFSYDEFLSNQLKLIEEFIDDL